MIEQIDSDKEECLVFFNPMGSSIHFWKRDFPQKLINNYEVIFVDYPGYNSQYIPIKSFDELASFYDKKLLSIIQKPMHFIGYSYGGLLILHLLNNKYQNLKSATLISCSNKLTIRDKEVVSVMKKIISYDMHLFSRTLSLFSHKPEQINNNPLIGLQTFSNLKLTIKDNRPVVQQLNHLLQMGEIKVKNQTVKSMLIYGEEDRLIDTSTLNRFNSFFKNLEIKKLENESHIIDTKKIFNHIIEFIKK